MKKTNLERILEHATDVLGSYEEAVEWVYKKSATLGDCPRNLSETEEGTNTVLQHLNGISRQRQA